jgi:hypothetical protein
VSRFGLGSPDQAREINALAMSALNQLPSSHAEIMTVALPTADYFHGTTIIFGA